MQYLYDFTEACICIFRYWVQSEKWFAWNKYYVPIIGTCFLRKGTGVIDLVNASSCMIIFQLVWTCSSNSSGHAQIKQYPIRMKQYWYNWMSCCPPQTISYFCEVAPIKVKVMPRLNVIVKLQSKVQASALD